MQFSLAALLAVAFSATSVYAACPDGAGNYPYCEGRNQMRCVNNVPTLKFACNSLERCNFQEGQTYCQKI